MTEKENKFRFGWIDQAGCKRFFSPEYTEEEARQKVVNGNKENSQITHLYAPVEDVEKLTKPEPFKEVVVFYKLEGDKKTYKTLGYVVGHEGEKAIGCYRECYSGGTRGCKVATLDSNGSTCTYREGVWKGAKEKHNRESVIKGVIGWSPIPQLTRSF